MHVVIIHSVLHSFARPLHMIDILLLPEGFPVTPPIMNQVRVSIALPATLGGTIRGSLNPLTSSTAL